LLVTRYTHQQPAAGEKIFVNGVHSWSAGGAHVGWPTQKVRLCRAAMRPVCCAGLACGLTSTRAGLQDVCAQGERWLVANGAGLALRCCLCDSSGGGLGLKQYCAV